MAVSIVVILLYYILLSTGVTLVRSGTLGPVSAMWMPNVVVAVLAVYFMRRVSRDRPALPSPSELWSLLPSRRRDAE